MDSHQLVAFIYLLFDYIKRLLEELLVLSFVFLASEDLDFRPVLTIACRLGRRLEQMIQVFGYRMEQIGQLALLLYESARLHLPSFSRGGASHLCPLT